MKKFWLWRPLQQAGASRSEAKELAALASRLHGAVPALGNEKKREIARELGIASAGQHGGKPRLALAGGLAVFLVIGISFVHTAQPGSALYSLHKAEDKIRSYVQPGYEPEQEHTAETEGSENEVHRSDDDRATRQLQTGTDDSEASESKDTSATPSQDSNKGSGSSTSGSSGSGSSGSSTLGIKIDLGGSGSSGSGNGSNSGSSGSGTSGSSGEGSGDDKGVTIQLQPLQPVQSILGGLGL